MKMNQEQIRIGQLAEILAVKNFVIRFWEKEFNVKPVRSDGGQRFYTTKEIEKFKLIKSLLYERGYTISGAKKALKNKPPAATSIVASTKTTLDPEAKIKSPSTDRFITELQELQEQLIKLQKLL
jgi:DNA-binding transcriptional MerR regulator